MLHYRKTYEVIGYAYEADLHCLECTQKRFGGNAYALDYSRIDGEGNEIHPVFLGDDTGEHCGDCFTRLDGDDDTPPDDTTEDDTDSED